ncbi:MAG TPA: AraC family transcriptional regulator [Longimicrobium sp.]
MASKVLGEQVRVWRPAALPGVEVMRVEGSYRLWRWYHDTYALCTAYGGTGEVQYRQGIHSVRPGDTLLMEPGEVHTDRRVEGPAAFRVLYVAPEVLARFREDGSEGPVHLRRAHTSDRTLFRVLTSLHEALDRGASALEAECRLALALHEVLSRFAAPGPRSTVDDAAAAPLMRARDLLHASPAQPVSLDELAAAAGLSKFHLLRAFAKRFGLPPHTYHTQLRIATARALLANGVSISRAALEAGFADQSHLTRHFARIVGVTPGAYVRDTRPASAWDDAAGELLADPHGSLAACEMDEEELLAAP